MSIFWLPSSRHKCGTSLLATNAIPAFRLFTRKVLRFPAPGKQKVFQVNMKGLLIQLSKLKIGLHLNWKRSSQIILEIVILMLITSAMTSWWDFEYCPLYSCLYATDFKLTITPSVFYLEHWSRAQNIALGLGYHFTEGKILSFWFKSYLDINMAVIF